MVVLGEQQQDDALHPHSTHLRREATRLSGGTQPQLPGFRLFQLLRAAPPSSHVTDPATEAERTPQ